MGKDTKYKISLGLVFNQAREMEMLSDMAKKGWIFHSFSKMGYNFIKSKPKKLIYYVDSNSLDEDEKEEYFKTFKDGGWTHICSYGDYYHFFSASPGTKPIYIDKETMISKYKAEYKDTVKITLFLMVVFLASIALSIILYSYFYNELILLIGLLVSGGLFGFMVMMFISTISLKLKMNRIKK